MARRKFTRFRSRGAKTSRKRMTVRDKTKQMVTGRPPTLLENIASGAGAVAKVAQAVLPAIMAINTEHKYADLTASVTSNTPGTNDVIVNLTGQIATGVDDFNRIGNSILAKDISVRMAMQFSPTSTVQGLHCRWMLVAWKANIQDMPLTAARLFESPTNLYSPVNRDYSDQLVVLKDKFFALNAPVAGTGTNPQAFTHWKFYKKLDWHMRWDAATTSDATTDHIYLIIRSSSATVSLGTTYYSRLNFTDN